MEKSKRAANPTWNQPRFQVSNKKLPVIKRMEQSRQKRLMHQQEETRQKAELRKQWIERGYQGEVIPELWEEYLGVAVEDRGTWERSTWYTGVEPLWFSTKKKELLEREYRLRRLEEKKQRKEERKSEQKFDKPSDQISLFDINQG